MERLSYTDSLYGQLEYEGTYIKLIDSPIFQRLRHIRLSNIDSINMPGIANLSRYEHALGVGYLATQTQLFKSLPRFEQIAFVSGALLHDWAITAFGHLVEEAFRYTQHEFDHEQKLGELLLFGDSQEVGGIELQILFGRQAKLRPWAETAVGIGRADALLREITSYIEGKAEFGRLIAGDMDLDNIDGVFRMALHMGLPVQRECPLSLARALVGIHKPTGAPLFRASASTGLSQWIQARHMVYEHLMLAGDDFVGKLMLLSATIEAIEAGEIRPEDWCLTDAQLVQRLRTSEHSQVREPVVRWLVGEPWYKTPLYWMKGSRPDFARLLAFSKSVSANLARRVFIYGIKDKRFRQVDVKYDDGTSQRLGDASDQWLIGAGAAERRPVSSAEVRTILRLAEEAFQSEVISEAASPWAKDQMRREAECLL